MVSWEEAERVCVDLGCGYTKYPGAIGLDKVKLKDVDISCDLDWGLPLKDNSVDQIYASHFLEHTNDLCFIMEEIWRVSKPKAKIEIIVPYWNSSLAFQDPTHKQFFSEFTFDYFTKDSKRRRPRHSFYDFKCDFQIKKMEFQYINIFSWLRFIPFGKWHPRHLFSNIVRELSVTLEATK